MLKFRQSILLVCFFSFAILTNAQDYETLIKDHLDANRSSFGITDQDIFGLVIKDEVFSKKSEATHVYATQKINNIEIFNGNINVAFKEGSIIHVASNLQKNIASRVNTITPLLTPLQAASEATISLGLGSADFSLIETVSPQEYILSKGGVSLEEIPIKLVYQPTEDNTLKLAWDLSIYTLDTKHWYSVRIDALNGELLEQHDWVLNCTFESHSHTKNNHNEVGMLDQKTTRFSIPQSNKVDEFLAGEQYNVFALPVETPNHGDASIVTNPQNLVASPFGWHDINGVEGAEFTITRGNNVWAQDDINGNNGAGSSPDGGAELNFNFDYNFETDPVNMLDAVLTNLFYWNNIMHDVFYQYGFDEASGNFQANNYGNGGTPNDIVLADAQDGSGMNNANFASPPDGIRPRMQMFLYNAPLGETLTINGGTLEGSYIGAPASFGDPLPPSNTPLIGNLALVQDDNAGNSTDPLDACDTIINGTDLNDQIVVIRRGECEFGAKVLSAENEGAIAVIMVNNVDTPPFGMAPGAVGASVTIPSIMVSQADGEAIIAALQGGETINVSLSDAGGFLLDSSLDNAIVTHEYGHGISIRLTGGRFNSGCLTNDEQMGEGWSDYVGLMLTMRATDSGEDARGRGTYANGQSADGPGNRVARYSTDFSVNDLTYGDVADSANISLPHGIGTVWTTMIWDMSWAFIDHYGFDPDVYNGTGGNNIALQLVIDGLKLQPCSPGFVDGRDAILAAVEINTLIPEEDKDQARCTIWNVFANRGLGLSAEQGSSNNRFDQVEAFDVPTNEDGSACVTLSVDEVDVNSLFNVYPNPSNGEITVSVVGSLGNGQVRIYDMNGRLIYKNLVELEGNVSVNAIGLSKGMYIMNITSDTSAITKKLIIE